MTTPNRRFKEHARCSAPKPESIVVDLWYTFSFNPQDQPTKRASERGRIVRDCLTEWNTQMVELFSRMKYCEITANLEIGSTGRLHYHGCIKILDIFQFYYVEIPLLTFYGSFEIDTIGSLPEWQDYCNKQRSFAEPFCLHNSVVYRVDSAQLREERQRPNEVRSIADLDTLWE